MASGLLPAVEIPCCRSGGPREEGTKASAAALWYRRSVRSCQIVRVDDDERRSARPPPSAIDKNR